MFGLGLLLLEPRLNLELEISFEQILRLWLNARSREGSAADLGNADNPRENTVFKFSCFAY